MMASNRDDDDFAHTAEGTHLIGQFCELCQVLPEEAIRHLRASDWDIDIAVPTFFGQMDEEPEDKTEADTEPEYTGPRTLDGRPAPQATSSRSTAKPAKKKGLATMNSIRGGADHDSDDDDDDDDEEDGRGPRDLFAGGKKSGLAVQDPAMSGPNSGTQKVIKDIIAKAKANASRPDEDDPQAGPSRPSRFTGSGQTLGGEGVESRSIPDPRGQQAASHPAPPTVSEPHQERVLHLWRDGFSVDDGELRRFDDPGNAADLQMIRSGRAPLHLMNIGHDGVVDVKLQQHDENWRQLPRIYRPFGGEGHRLGSPVPGESDASAAAVSTPSASATSTSQAAQAESTSVDESQPTLMLRIQLPDGSRLPARFNLSQTVNDVYQFVQRASTVTQGRNWVLATTFPSKEHTNRSLVLGEMTEFKRGGTAIVKWA